MQNPFLLSCLRRVLCNFNSTWVQSPHWASPLLCLYNFGESFARFRLFSFLPNLVDVGAFETTKRRGLIFDAELSSLSPGHQIDSIPKYLKC